MSRIERQVLINVALVDDGSENLVLLTNNVMFERTCRRIIVGIKRTRSRSHHRSKHTHSL